MAAELRITRPRLQAALFAWLAALALVLGSAGAAQATSIVIDFESLEPKGGGWFTPEPSPYEEHGFRLWAEPRPGPDPDPFAFWEPPAAPGGPPAHFAGSLALFNLTGGDTTTLESIGGGAFDLISIDLSELYKLPGQDVSVTFVGTYFDDTTVTRTFHLDGDFGFETFYFNGDNGEDEFTNLKSVSWDQDADYHQFDNITLVPEPGTLALFALGALGLAAHGRRPRARR